MDQWWREAAVDLIRDDVHQAVIADARSFEALSEVVSKDFDEAIVTPGESLETSISNFIQKLKGQIALKEALTGENELMFLEAQVNTGMDSQRNCLYDFDTGFFREHGSNLVKKYY